MSEIQVDNSEIQVDNSEIQVDNSEFQLGDMSEEASVKQPGFFKRLLWVFTSPGKLMENLAEKPRVLFWMIFGSLPMAILYIVRMPLYKETLRKAILAQSEIYEAYGMEMTPEMVEASLPASVITGLISIPFATIIGFLLTALLFFIILKLMNGQGKYKAYLSVTVHANIITVLYTFLLIPISHITGSLHDSAPLTSLATLAPLDMAGTPFYTFLANIDIFRIWYYVLLAIGFCAVSRVKKKKVYIVTAVIFLVGLLISIAGISAASALF